MSSRSENRAQPTAPAQHALVALTASPRRVVLSIVALLAVAGLAVAIVEYTAWRMRSSDRSVRLSFASTGATIVIDADNKLRASFPVPACAGWVNSGIDVPPNSSLRITATGHVNLAIHHTVEHAKSDTPPPFGWTDPNGRDWNNPRSKDRPRRKGLLARDANIGALLACLHADGDPPPDLKDNPRPKRLKIIGSQSTIMNSEDFPRTLWFAVNDVVLPQEVHAAREMYFDEDSMGDSDAETELEKRFDAIVSANYLDLWFDDNAGHFLVRIEEE